MKTVSSLFTITLLLLAASPAFLASKASAATGYTDVTVVQAKSMIDTNPSLVILDVRNQSEYVTGHIRNAKLIPLFMLNSSLNQLNPADEILVYCKSGARSTTASEILIANGFLQIYNMAGGITAWTEIAGYPTYVEYASLQEAVDNATDGSTIYVSSGEYLENLIINKSINLVGENRDTTIIDGMSNGTVVYVGSDNTSISDFKLQYSGCSCSEYYGIDVGSARKNVSITNNNIFSDSTGILVIKGENIQITRNNITHSRDYPIAIQDSVEVSISENDVVNNLNQIDAQNSTQSNIVNNNITSNGNGIALTDSNNNTVTGNVIALNSLYGLYVSHSDYNVIIHNSLQSNGLQSNGGNAYIRNSTDYWDDGFEGNYWSNYTGTDADHDGVGDTVFVLDASNVDNHPLTGAFHSFHAIPGSEVGLISDSVLDSFEFVPPETIRLRVSNATADQTSGFCRIIIPHALIDPNNGTIQIIIDNNQTQVLFLNTTVYDNGTHRWVYIAYPLSTHDIVIVPEDRVFLVTVLLMVLVTGFTGVAVFYRKRRLKATMVHGLR